MKDDPPGSALQDKESPSGAPPEQAPVSKRVIPRRPPRSKFRRIFLLFVLLILLAGGYFLWRYLASYESTDDAQVDVHLSPVSARISGYVIKVLVGDNQWVEQGTELVEIDPTDYQVAVDKARRRSGERRGDRAIPEHYRSDNLRQHHEPVDVFRLRHR